MQVWEVEKPNLSLFLKDISFVSKVGSMRFVLLRVFREIRGLSLKA